MSSPPTRTSRPAADGLPPVAPLRARRAFGASLRALLAALALALCACPGPPKPTTDDVLEHLRRSGGGGGECQPPPLEIFLQADAVLNRNPQGQPMPVEVRVLLLREREAFDQLDFEGVWRSNPTTLGKDLVGSASLTVFPGEFKIYPMKSPPGVAYVALVGIFRRPEGQSWRHVVDVKEQSRRCARSDDLHTTVHALLRGNAIGKPD
jgi:type VI secretion system protein VasD